MPLDLTAFDVYLADEGVTLEKAIETGEYAIHRVTVVHADQLVAEQAGPRYGLRAMTDAPMAYATLWCWAALSRMGIPVPEFPLFKTRVLSVDKVKTPEGDVSLDPTTAGPGTGSP
jgi:hypothetical protein